MPNRAPTLTPEEAMAIAGLWSPGAHEVTHLRTGENSVWGFEGRGGQILRVTSEAHRRLDELNAELAFVEHLVANGVNAARPVESLSGEKVVDVSRMIGSDSPTYAIVFERLEGRHFVDYSNDVGRPLFHEWGRTMAHLHLRAQAFVAPPGLRRPDWQQDEVAGCSFLDLEIDDRLLEIRNELVGWLSGKTHESAHYGMVHGDFERSNFVLNDGAIGIFDFDDCCYHWFCWDIACALWRFRHAPRDDRAAFLSWFLDGYASIREPDTVMLERFSDWIRLRAVALLLYRARAGEARQADDWTERTRSWLDSAWNW